MLNNNQGNYPGEGHYYNQIPHTEWPTPQNFGPGSQGGKLPDQPPKQRNIWRIVAMVMSIMTAIFAITTVLAYNHIINPIPRSTVVATPVAQQPTSAPANGTPTSASTPSSTATAQSSATVADGLIQKNITLTCSGCNDPIRVTINTIRIDNANGRMIWDTTLKDVTGNAERYQIDFYNLQVSGSLTKVAAVLQGGEFTGANDIQAVFAFIPYQNVTYILTVEVGAIDIGVKMTFDPVKITF